MADNPRITLYMPRYPTMKLMAEEDGHDMNGAFLEQQFFDNACGNIKILQDIIKRLYLEELSFREALLQILKYIRFSDIEKRSFYDALPVILQDACGDCAWLTDSNKNIPDEEKEMLKKLQAILDFRYQQEVKDDEIFADLDSGDMEIDYGEDDDLEGYSVEEQDAIENYMDLTIQKDKISNMIESGNAKPGEVLSFINRNWYFFYNHQEVYEVIDFCAANAVEVADNSYLKKRLRDFVKFISLMKDIDQSARVMYNVINSRWDMWLLSLFGK